VSRDCARCGREVGDCEEAWILEIVTTLEGKNGPIQSILLDEAGDYYGEPYFLHFECWEQVMEHLYEAAKDEPPTIADTFGAKCGNCHSWIEIEEPYCVATFCEIQAAAKFPDGEPAPCLHRIGNPAAYCLGCIAYVTDDTFPLWIALLEQAQETPS
jgi:hypothetical protein